MKRSVPEAAASSTKKARVAASSENPADSIIVMDGGDIPPWLISLLVREPSSETIQAEEVDGFVSEFSASLVAGINVSGSRAPSFCLEQGWKAVDPGKSYSPSCSRDTGSIQLWYDTKKWAVTAFEIESLMDQSWHFAASTELRRLTTRSGP